MKIAGIIIAVLGIALIPQGEYLGAAAFIAVGILLLFLWYRKKQSYKAAVSEPWPDTYRGHALAYSHRETLLYIPEEYRKKLPHIKAGTELDISKEPQNTYDNKAVKFSYHGKTVGYAYKNGTQDMLNDWLDRGHPVIAKFVGYPQPENASVNLAFYRNKKQDKK